jgi:uncharacterized protein YjbJ (UPF0337 family)
LVADDCRRGSSFARPSCLAIRGRRSIEDVCPQTFARDPQDALPGANRKSISKKDIGSSDRDRPIRALHLRAFHPASRQGGAHRNVREFIDLSWNFPLSACFCSAGRELQEAAMSWGHVRANWKQFQLHAKQRWNKLTDEDIAHIKGHREALIECLQERYGYPRDRAQQEVREWEHHF